LKIISKRGMSGLTELLVTLVFIGGILIWLSLPWSLPIAIKYLKTDYINNSYFFSFIIIFLYITGALSLIVVYQIRKFFNSINNNTPFIRQNERALKIIGYACFAISVCFFIKDIFYPTILTIIVTMIFIIAGFFGIVLGEIFQQAVDVKKENDMTI